MLHKKLKIGSALYTTYFTLTKKNDYTANKVSYFKNKLKCFP